MTLPRSVRLPLVLLCSTLFLLGSIQAAFASAYNARPKLIVVIVIDQFRGDYLERYRDQFGDSGFRVFLDRGAYFTDCYYDYANTRTAPGHATLFTGSYTSGHGIVANEWWDPQKKKRGDVGGGRHDKTGRRRALKTCPSGASTGHPGCIAP